MPFYIEDENGNWVRFIAPTDIRNTRREVVVSVYPNQKDPEQLTLHIPEKATTVATTERLGRFFPGQQGVVNRDNVFIDDLSTGKKIAVIHSNKPIGK